MANIVVAYICWLVAGPLGFHHFYLGRDRHALVWFMSFGGFLLGWFRDLWRLPEYVYEANQDRRFRNEFAVRRDLKPKPPFSIVRFAGQIIIGQILAYLGRLFIPEKTLQTLDADTIRGLTVMLPVIGSAIGVSLVANISHRKVAFKWCFLGSLVGIPWLLQTEPSLMAPPLFASILASWKNEWDPDWKPSRGACKCLKRTFVLSLCGFIYMSLWTSVIYYNVHIKTNDGMEIPINEAMENFFNSPAWKQFKKTLGDLYNFCQHNGWSHCYHQFIEQIDPSGEAHAYKVLEFEGEKPSAKEIQSRCRKLSKKWHPDTLKTEAEKIAGQEKFIEVQKACEVLNDLRKRRSEKNKKSDTNPFNEKHEHTEF